MLFCYSSYITQVKRKWGVSMIFSIDFDSDEAIYMQLCNQVILKIAMDQLKDGENLPSVLQMADTIGINMHTVNKAYTILRQQGYITMDKRRGAVITVNIDKLAAIRELEANLKVLVAGALCRNVSTDEIHMIVDDVINEFINGR